MNSNLNTNISLQSRNSVCCILPKIREQNIIPSSLKHTIKPSSYDANTVFCIKKRKISVPKPITGSQKVQKIKGMISCLNDENSFGMMENNKKRFPSLNKPVRRNKTSVNLANCNKVNSLPIMKILELNKLKNNRTITQV